jgi:hypothetical protein
MALRLFPVARVAWIKPTTSSIFIIFAITPHGLQLAVLIFSFLHVVLHTLPRRLLYIQKLTHKINTLKQTLHSHTFLGILIRESHLELLAMITI